MMRILLGLLFFLPSFNALAVLGDDVPVIDITPAGTEIYDGRLAADTIEIEIDIFYFYKKHLIGKSLDNQYFIYNEKSNKVQIFAEENNWQKAIQSQNLQPRVWTRWHQVNWNYINDFFMGMIIITALTGGTALLFVGLFFLIMYWIINVISRYNQGLRNVIYIFLVVFIVSKILLQNFPLSI